MDREELNAMLTPLENDEVFVKPDGTVVNKEDDTEFTPEQVADAITEMEEVLTRLRKIAEWAKGAPEKSKE